MWGFSTPNIEGLDEELGDCVQVASGDLQRQQHQHREPVEEVMHCGPSKRPEQIKHGKKDTFRCLSICLMQFHSAAQETVY